MPNPDILILIRWNIVLGFGQNVRVNIARAKSDWHKRRIEMWRRYCMPSLIRQTYQDWQAWLLCDPDETEQNHELLRTIEDPRISLVTHWSKAIGAFIQSGDPDDLVAICRIDSDDMYEHGLLSLFCQSAQTARNQNKRYIQPSKGYALDVWTGRFYHWQNPSPPFFAAIMPRHDANKMSGGRHVANHTKVKNSALTLNGKPLFCVTLHDVNICNSTRAAWLKDELKGNELDRARIEYGMVS